MPFGSWEERLKTQTARCLLTLLGSKGQRQGPFEPCWAQRNLQCEISSVAAQQHVEAANKLGRRFVWPTGLWAARTSARGQVEGLTNLVVSSVPDWLPRA